MPHFRKKAIEVEAYQWTGDNFEELVMWAKRYGYRLRRAATQEEAASLASGLAMPNVVIIESRHTSLSLRALCGDWFVRGGRGRDVIYPVESETFAQTYEEID